MRITVCGSMQFEREMKAAAAQLESFGYDTEIPNSVEGHAYGEGVNLDTIVERKQGFIREHFAKIDKSEGILVANYPKNGVDGYIGSNTLMEMTYAFSQGLDIYTLCDLPTNVGYASEINALSPVVLQGDIAALHTHVESLPLAYISSNSPVKHTAVGRGFRKAGIAVRTKGMKVDSNVSEQPQTIDETYSGAIHRHQALTQQLGKTAADYYVTIESGLAPLHENHNVFGCTAIVVEKAGREPKVGIDVDIEFPRSFTDKVPAVYPDIGVLVQEEFGSELKDPYPFMTNHQLTRAKIVEEGVYRVAIQTLLDM